MSKCFILGLKTSVQDSPFLSTHDIYNEVGHNTGNLAFHYAINKQLGGQLESLPWHADINEINNAGDIAVLPAANQIGEHADYGGLAKKFHTITKPIVAIGLGAQSGINKEIPIVPPGTIEWVKEIAAHSPSKSPNIGVRGQFTFDVLTHYGLSDNCEILGCPTLFINPEIKLGQKILSNTRFPKRVAVPAGHQNWLHLSKIEESLSNIVTNTNGSYIGQSPLQMVQLTRGEARKLDENDISQCHKYIAPKLKREDFINWSERFGNVFFDIPSWMEHYKHFDLVIGTRIHGVMLALQAGVPGICIAHDSRTVELCQTMLIPYITSREIINGFTLEEIFSKFHFDAHLFDENRKKLSEKYTKFLKNNNLKPHEYTNFAS